MAAKRFALSLPAGTSLSQNLPWDTQCRGCALDWQVVALDGATVDIKVSARLNPLLPGRGFSFVVLQEVLESRQCHGSFDPGTDDRILGPGFNGQEMRADVDIIIFEVTNTGWFSQKQVEIVAATRSLGPPPAKVKQLPARYPLAPLTRVRLELAPDASAELPQLLALAPRYLPHPDARLCDVIGAQLAASLAVVKAAAANVENATLLEELESKLGALRQFCEEQAALAPPPTLEVLTVKETNGHAVSQPDEDGAARPPEVPAPGPGEAAAEQGDAEVGAVQPEGVPLQAATDGTEQQLEVSFDGPGREESGQEGGAEAVVQQAEPLPGDAGAAPDQADVNDGAQQPEMSTDGPGEGLEQAGAKDAVPELEESSGDPGSGQGNTEGVVQDSEASPGGPAVGLDQPGSNGGAPPPEESAVPGA